MIIRQWWCSKCGYQISRCINTIDNISRCTNCGGVLEYIDEVVGVGREEIRNWFTATSRSNVGINS